MGKSFLTSIWSLISQASSLETLDLVSAFVNAPLWMDFGLWTV